MKRQQTKIYKQEAPSQSEGGLLELLVFALLFVIVFSVLARSAHAAEAKSPRSSKAAPVAPATAGETSPVSSESAKPLGRQGQNVAVPSGALPESSVRAAIPEPETAKRFGWSSKVVVETTVSKTDENKDSIGGWYQLATGITDRQNNITAQLKLGWAQEFSYPKLDNTNGDLDNPGLAVFKVWKRNSHFFSQFVDSFTLGVSGAAGASRESARRTFIASIGPSAAVATTFFRFVHVGQAVGYSRGFYGYDIRDDGAVNAPNVLKSTTDLSLAITPKLSLSASLLLTHAISFQGVGRTTQLAQASFDYSALENLVVSLGVATERGTSNEDGQQNSVKIFDRNVAQGVFDLIYSF